MSMRRVLLAGTAALLVCGSVTTAQAPTNPPTATLAQVMRGILFPSSNVIFAAQHDEFATVKPDADLSLSTDPIKSVYGGWEAVENASLALVEATRLITVLGRKCPIALPLDVPRETARTRGEANRCLK